LPKARSIYAVISSILDDDASDSLRG